MASRCLVPIGVGSYSQVSFQNPSSGAFWDKIDDGETPDGDLTYIYELLSEYHYSTFQMTDVSGMSGKINSVTIHAIAKKSGATYTGRIYPFLHFPAVPMNYGTGSALTTSYADYQQSWVTNPQTSAEWQWTDFAGIELGVGLKSEDVSQISMCTSLYCIVDYGTSGGQHRIIGMML